MSKGLGGRLFQRQRLNVKIIKPQMILMTFERGIAELKIHEAVVFERNRAGFVRRIIEKPS